MKKNCFVCKVSSIIPINVRFFGKQPRTVVPLLDEKGVIENKLNTSMKQKKD